MFNKIKQTLYFNASTVYAHFEYTNIISTLFITNSNKQSTKKNTIYLFIPLTKLVVLNARSPLKNSLEAMKISIR